MICADFGDIVLKCFENYNNNNNDGDCVTSYNNECVIIIDCDIIWYIKKQIKWLL